MCNRSRPRSHERGKREGAGVRGQGTAGAGGTRGANVKSNQYPQGCFKNHFFVSRKVLRQFPSGHGGQEGRWHEWLWPDMSLLHLNGGGWGNEMVKLHRACGHVRHSHSSCRVGQLLIPIVQMEKLRPECCVAQAFLLGECQRRDLNRSLCGLDPQSRPVLVILGQDGGQSQMFMAY